MVYCSVVEECFHANGGCAAASYVLYVGRGTMCVTAAV